MYNSFKLNNGVKVVLESIDYVNSVTVGIWIKNGSRNENKYNNGISHFIEHMLFKGTKTKSAKEIVECIEDVGGQLNAFTGKEATCFYIKILDTHLELALDILSDMLFNSLFLEEDIEKEKKVIIEEIKMNIDNPEDMLMDLYSKAAYGEDSLSLPILGEIQTVKSFNRNSIIEYINNMYSPENTVISISGKVDSNSIEKIIERYFGHWENKNLNNPEIKSQGYSYPILNKSHLFLNKKIEQLHMNLGMSGLVLGDDNMYALMLLNTYFGGGASSILFQKIREELGMCYTIYSYISSYVNSGTLNIYTSMNPKSSLKAIKYIKNELENFKVDNLLKERDKIFKLKEQLKGNFILGLESTSSRMFRNGRIALFFDKIIPPEEILNKIDEVNTDKLNYVMENTFSNGIENSAFVGENFDEDKIIRIFTPDKVAFKNSKKVEL
ncbi:protease 3 precursor [Clostridium homopropionicum DSM 5847]|uniref:Protease 3 n=1 Tax=Clostridium homopropionicum DSM 5847 TaxID=1121318 RepID=A0A0L6ZDL1_9CLOT|nr:pitrilysin family protein [Clostridium homopropionicum]KOA20883.1 protease 3 precursor [Clostridium homopropionicum DSM 5847]SFG02960.1 Predicted Zn-dependent peptidase [Clostridium homopropionicum]